MFSFGFKVLIKVEALMRLCLPTTKDIYIVELIGVTITRMSIRAIHIL